MTINTQDRPIEKIREEVVDQLIMNYSHGEITHEAFERRLDQAMESTDKEFIISLTADLTLTIDNEYLDKKNNRFDRVVESEPSEEVEQIVSIFGSGGRSGAWQLPRLVKMLSIFSGSEIDLTDATFSSTPSKINVISVFAGDTIYVPEDINIVYKGYCLFGAVDNSAQSVNDPNRPTVIIEGFSLFASIEIKVKKSFKERMFDFADSLKELFSSDSGLSVDDDGTSRKRSRKRYQ